jgi:hypothetical protein
MSGAEFPELLAQGLSGAHVALGEEDRLWSRPCRPLCLAAPLSHLAPAADGAGYTCEGGLIRRGSIDIIVSQVGRPTARVDPAGLEGLRLGTVGGPCGKCLSFGHRDGDWLS